ncbi:MAG: carboxypeptidase regulatory-like domain-containing protein [Proteobacteria bacterium]|nr:MAG: carboxypeptidase regulatory-like domain-containing protein [Pseudomonadota bacterium]
MKLFLSVSFLFTCFTSLAQGGGIEVRITYSDSMPRSRFDSFNFKNPVFVELFRGDTSVFYSYQTQDKPYVIPNLEAGRYRLVYNRTGLRPVTLYDLQVVAGTVLSIHEYYPGPCRFQYVGKRPPECPQGRKDHIIPIVYGFPSEKAMKKAKAGKIRLGSCVVTKCDPKYFCTVHQREL